MKKKILLLLAVVVYAVSGFAQTTDGYEILKDISYYPRAVCDTNDYIAERGKLDMYYPKTIKKFPTVVWIHGGGLHGGYKQMPGALREQGFAIAGVNYRLTPKAKAVNCIEDVAAAVAWVFEHIEDYGGDSTQIYISGHSAGGYLTSMVGMDKRWLAKYNIDANRIAALLPLSGHTITHFTVRKEMGIEGTQPIIDDLAPLYHVRKDAPPIVLITGDREMELLGRYEENAYFYRMMKVVGHEEIYLHEIKGIGHGMTHDAFPMVIEYLRKFSGLNGDSAVSSE